MQFRFESNLSKQEKNNQLIDFIGGGIVPSNFLINNDYDKINQKRNIQLINLNDVLLLKKFKFFKINIQSYIMKKIKINLVIFLNHINFKIKSKNLNVNSKEFNDLFFKKIDEIDDLIVRRKKFRFYKKI